MWKVKLKWLFPSALLTSFMQFYWQTLALYLFSLPCNLHYDIHLMPSVSCSKHSDYLSWLQGLKLKVPLVTSIYSGSLLKTVFNLFWCSEYPFSGSGFCTPFPGELAAQEPGFKSLNDLSDLNNSWAWSGCQSSLGCISQPVVLCGLQHCPECTQGSGLDPCPWQFLDGLLSQLNVHVRFDFTLCLSEDLHTLHHAEGRGLNFCTFPDLGSFQHTTCVRVLWSSGSTNDCLHHFPLRNSLSRA